MIKKIGQIGLGVALVGLCGTVLVSVISGWATASNRTAKIETKVEVVKTTEELHYKELVGKIDAMDEKIDKFDEKLDELLKKQ